MDTLLPVLVNNSKGIPNQWPHIERYLWVDDSTDWVDGNFFNWSWTAKDLSPAERAAAYEEWAGFYEWRLKQQAAELAADRYRRHLLEEWTDSMAYCCRRAAIFARGDDPGAWVTQSQRRPDLYAEGEAILAEIIAQLDANV